MLSLLLHALATSSPSLQLRTRPHDDRSVVGQLRGGADSAPPAAGPAPPSTAPAPTALTPEEITEKLNGVPVFCMQNKGGGILSMRDPDGGDMPVCRWFVDANEAKMVLKAAIQANPHVEGVEIGVYALGHAFKLCGGWPDEVMPDIKATLSTSESSDAPPGLSAESISFRLQGNHVLVNETTDQLKQTLISEGVEPGAWALPVFFHEKLQVAGRIFPVFFHPADLRDAWVQLGLKDEDRPEQLRMMDLRSFVAMLQKPDNPWQLVQFVASRAAIRLAKGEPDDEEDMAPGVGGGAAESAAAGDEVEDLLGQQEDEEL